MKFQRPKNPNAFPARIEPGMTLRDYFAAKAMQGLINQYDIYSDITAIVTDAYHIADAMLKERENHNA